MEMWGSTLLSVGELRDSVVALAFVMERASMWTADAETFARGLLMSHGIEAELPAPQAELWHDSESDAVLIQSPPHKLVLDIRHAAVYNVKR